MNNFFLKIYLKKYISLILLVICSCNSIKENNKNIVSQISDEKKISRLDNDSSRTLIESTKQDFVISDSFIEADDETFLSLLIDAQSLVNLTPQEREENLIRWKKNTRIFVNKNDFAENIVVNKSELQPNQSTLDLFNYQLETQALQLLNNNIELKLINSNFGMFNNKADFIFIKSMMLFDGISRYSCQYILSLNNNNYHIVINTFDGLEINDVFKEINNFNF